MEQPLDPAAQHLAVLQQAFDSLGNGSQGGNTATIVVQGGAKICINSDLLLFHSPFFRTLLGSVSPFSSSSSITLSIPDASASALLALESLLSKGVTKCDSKADAVEALAKLLGVKQIKVSGAERNAALPATILPAAIFREVTEGVTLKVEPVDTLEENVGRGSARAPPIVRPPRPARPVPAVQAVKRKEVPEGSEKKSEKSRREELLEMALLNSGRNLSPASSLVSTTYATGSLTHSAPKQLPGTGLTIAPVLAPSPSNLPAGIASLQGQSKLANGKESPVTGKLQELSPGQKLQGQNKPPLAPKPPLLANSSPRQTTIKPAVTSSLQTSLNSKQIEALLSAPSIGSPTLQQAPAGTPKGRSAEFSFPNSNYLASLGSSRDSANFEKRRGSADSSRCNFSLQCEVCKTQAKTLSTLYSHCASHFHKRVEEKHKDLMQGLKCTLCGSIFKSKYLLTNHIGCKHGKINDILEEQGYKVLPCPITGTKQDEIQRNMISIKKERLERDSNWMEGNDESHPETPPAAKKQNLHAQTLNEILAKYNSK